MTAMKIVNELCENVLFTIVFREMKEIQILDTLSSRKNFVRMEYVDYGISRWEKIIIKVNGSIE